MFKNKVLYRSQQRFRSDHHKKYAEDVNKIALSSNDDKIIQTFDKVTTYDLIAKNVNACTSTDDLIAKNYVNICTSTDDLIVKNHADACTNETGTSTNENKPSTNENENKPSANENEPSTNDDSDDSDDSDATDDDDDSDSDDDSDDDSDSDDDDDDSNDNEPNTSGNNDNKPSTSGNENNNDNKQSKNDNKDNKDNEESHQISPSEFFSNNITKTIKLVDELENDEIYDGGELLVYAQLNKINVLLDKLIDHVWLILYNNNTEKNEIINIGIDKDKDIEAYVKIYKKILDDKFEFVNRIVELYNIAIDKKEFNNLKADILKLISNSSICDVEKKDCKKDNIKKDSGAKRKGCKKDNSKNVNKDKDKDKDNLIDKLLNNNKDKLHNFSDKV